MAERERDVPGGDGERDHPAVPLLRDPPPPPGYTDPVQESEVLEEPFTSPEEE